MIAHMKNLRQGLLRNLVDILVLKYKENRMKNKREANVQNHQGQLHVYVYISLQMCSIWKSI